MKQSQTGRSISSSKGSEILYNGIQLPEVWPPLDIERSRAPIEIPYLKTIPKVISINIGRQLFVDDFLIEETTLHRKYYLAEKFKGNPILKPETVVELNGGNIPVAAPFNDGIWYDDKDQLFKMWYHAGWFSGTAYATSKDGIHWQRPVLDVVPGTNLILKIRNGYRRDGCTVWLDKETSDSSKRFKMFLYNRYSGGEGGEIYYSADGIHWILQGNTATLGDNSGFFYNPFRKKWVFSIRSTIQFNQDHNHRVRDYHEDHDFYNASQWEGRPTPHKGGTVIWLKADHLDQPNKMVGDTTQLYDVDAIAYESIMLGFLGIHKGPKNSICELGGFPKITDLNLGYSRDGFHFYRPDRRAFIASTNQIGSWDRAYIHSVGGGCLVVGDSLYFYYSAWSGESPNLKNHMYAGGSTGLAVLRRDGFASLDADENEGCLVTRPVRFRGGYMFVNINNPDGSLQVEVLDEGGKIIQPFTKANCDVIKTNQTIAAIKWKDGTSLSLLQGKTVRLKFYLKKGSLYSFWVTPNKQGASYGYISAGGPGYGGSIDTIGIGAIK